MFSLNQKYLKKVLNIHLIIDQKSSKIIYIIGAMKKKKPPSAGISLKSGGFGGV